jgi:hypothetical protein
MNEPGTGEQRGIKNKFCLLSNLGGQNLEPNVIKIARVILPFSRIRPVRR